MFRAVLLLVLLLPLQDCAALGFAGSDPGYSRCPAKADETPDRFLRWLALPDSLLACPGFAYPHPESQAVKATSQSCRSQSLSSSG